MAKTWAEANTERLRLLRLGKRLQVRLIKCPVRGDDGAVWPGGDAVNDWLLEIKDPRPTGASPGGDAANETGLVTMQVAIAVGRWYGGANEHYIRMRGLLSNEARGGAAPNTQWTLWGAGETREGGQIPSSATLT